MRLLIALLIASVAAMTVADEPKPAKKEAAGGGGKAKCVVYVSVGGENRITAYEMGAATGKLSFLASSDVGGAPGSLTLHPSRQFLYAAIRSTGSVATLRVDPKSGRLAPIDVVPVAGNPVYVATDRAGKFLLTAYYGDAKAAVYAIGPDGAARGGAIQVLLTGKNPHSINVDATNRSVYVPNTGADKILQFRLNEKSGLLAPLTTPSIETTAGTGPRHMCFHPGGDFVYAVNEKSSSVTVFRRHRETGVLAELQTLSTLPPGFKGMNTCADIEITPAGEHLYASNRGHDSLARFSVDLKSGLLTPLGHTPTEKTPREFAIDPAGRFLYAAGQDSGKLAAYKIDPATGQLAEIETYTVGKSPAWVLVAPLPK
jgi:6-phosphogluconolactonase